METKEQEKLSICIEVGGVESIDDIDYETPTV